MVRKFKWWMLAAAGAVFMPFAGLQADHMGGGMGKGGGGGMMGQGGMGKGGGCGMMSQGGMGNCPMQCGGMGSGMGMGKGGMGKGMGMGLGGMGEQGMGGQAMAAQTQQMLQMNMMRNAMVNQATIQQSRMVGDVQQNIRNQYAFQAAAKKAMQQANSQKKADERTSQTLGFVSAPPGLSN